jgi:hypothetical protein
MGIGSSWENFFDKQAKNTAATAKFIEKPTSPEVFFRDWMGQPLFPEQLNPINAMFTPDLENLNPDINEILLMFGEGAGKDFLCERMLIYVAYWLLCHKSPQKYLGRAEGTPIDLVNTSVNEEHASNVFFEQFCEAVKLVINPITGKNWFEEQGMDIRSGRDILTTKVRFPKNITAYSCNSVKYTAEGKNVLIGILDEIAEFKYDRAKSLYTNLKATATSRFPNYHKIILISYLRDQYDFMNSHWNEMEALPESLRRKVYMSKKATWEVNLMVSKADYADAYAQDPEDSARRYENIMPSKTGQKFIKNGIKITNAVYDFDGSPIISETPHVSTNINEETLQVWFKAFYIKEIYRLEQELALSPNSAELRAKIDALKDNHSGANYYIHIDLAKGAVDYAGFCMLHTYQKTESQIGYYTDLIVQLQPDGNEINFEQIREFIFKLQSMGFPIAKVSLDGWSCQLGTNKIKLLNGTTKRVDEVTQKEWIYAFDSSTNRIVPAECNPARKTGENIGCYGLLLDNGEQASFTAEHKILMLNGTYKRVIDLIPGDQIRPLEFREKNIWGGGSTYLQVHQPSNKTKKWQFVHKIVSITYIGKKDVYDLEVPNYHNVGLECGIFAHNSTDFMQLLDKRGIPCELVSLDRTMQPYNTLKDLLYQEILEYYYNPILLRELNELQIINNKVDHPKESTERLKEEGKRLGSKDLADSLAGAVFTASSAGGSGSGCVVELVPEEAEDKLDKLF